MMSLDDTSVIMMFLALSSVYAGFITGLHVQLLSIGHHRQYQRGSCCYSHVIVTGPLLDAMNSVRYVIEPTCVSCVVCVV
ncbi:hypothetical protein F4801DRAFT_549061 [Xylaria longipes]|nr:hypothetical protein F4801DRAFT_549061 [Xylaria longipes]